MNAPFPPEWLLAIYPEGSEKREFAFLASMLDSNFHQDYAMVSEDFEEIVRQFRAVSDDNERRGVVNDINRFLTQFGKTDETLKAAMSRIFYDGPIVEGWNGLTIRQWLERVAEVLS